MSKKPFKSQASSSRAVFGALGGVADGAAFGSTSGTSGFGAISSSLLSYVYEPPDLSELSEPNVGVAFKNLQKKDGTTKAKALEDLQAYVSPVQAEGVGVEEAILEAWIKVYPRTSIDASRRVRQLAHVIQGQIAVSCGKRMARHMPTIVASWLAGLYDNDKSVSRASHESFKRVFASEEKMRNLWRVYQGSISEYARDVIVKESVSTLSDERTTSPDDASAKYSRVVGAAILMVTNLLESSSEAELEKSQTVLDQLINEEKIWKLASHTDPYVRRALYRFLVVVLAKKKNALNPSMISASILMSGLHTSQAGSSLDYARALATASTALPEVWTTHYTGTGKKSAVNRLCHFLKKGSQGGPAEYWSYVATLMSSLPSRFLMQEGEEGSEKKAVDDVRSYSFVLSALHEGVTNKDEPRTSQGAAWNTYLKTSELVYTYLPTVERGSFFRVSVFPIVSQYIRPSTDYSGWAVIGPQQQIVCLRACSQILQGGQEAFDEEWRALSSKIIQDLRTSLPEQSKEYVASQDRFVAETDRWYRLQARIIEQDATNSVRTIITQCISPEIQCFVSTLKARNGKPYGAAAALESSIRLLPDVILGNSETKETLSSFVDDTVPDLLLSPSVKYLIRIIHLSDQTLGIHQGYQKSMRALSDAPESATKSIALQSFVSSPSLASSDSLFTVVMRCLHQAMKDDDGMSWDLVMAALGNPIAPRDLTDDILATMIEGLSINRENLTGLHGLEMTMKQNGSMVKDFALSAKGTGLLSRLILLADLPNEAVSRRARALNTLIEKALAVDGGSVQATNSIIEIVNTGLDNAGSESLSVDALVAQARKVLDSRSSNHGQGVVEDLFPSLAQWTTALEPFVTRPFNLSLATTNPFGSALSLVSQAPKDAIEQAISRDADGSSLAVRVAQYTTQLVKVTDVLDSATKDQRVFLCKEMALFLQIAGDNLSVAGSMPLWDSSDPELDSEMVDFVAEAQGLLGSWLTSEFIPEVQTQLLDESSGLSAISYYSGRAYLAMTMEINELQGHANYKDAGWLKATRKSPDIFTVAAYFASAPESKELLRLCNEILADLTGRNFHQNNCLRDLVLMNCILSSQEDYINEIPQQRLIFFVKHVTQALQDKSLSTSLVGGEIMRALVTILPRVSDIYGSFWEELLVIVQEGWDQAVIDDNIYRIHASLRLLSLLSKPHMQESNDDLLDFWTDKKQAIAGGLIDLLNQLADISDDAHQPRRIVNELLSRLLSSMSQNITIDGENLYPVLASESAALQQSAYELLHRYIPSVQEQISVDKALSKDFVPRLPEELLSLILAAPSTVALADYNLVRTLPATLRTYLFSWKLTFDHWQNASYKVQEDYVTCLKEGTYVKDLLDLIFEFLISGRSKPVDGSKFEIENYMPDVADGPEKEIQWLLIHLYYLCLRHLPSLSKEWWRDTTSRQLNLAVEKWTEKHISPLITTAELTTVSHWAPSQGNADQPLNVKVSQSAREITASIPIDEQTMSISIRLPPSYPLARAEVEGIHRVGVNEKKWRYWIINTQGVINLSSGGAGEGNALIDGLLAWRKNVTATMKGQTECAICYSVVSAERQLPSKRCNTCKNMFHGACLFKWFKSSNSSSCPLCRNAFHYS